MCSTDIEKSYLYYAESKNVKISCMKELHINQVVDKNVKIIVFPPINLLLILYKHTPHLLPVGVMFFLETSGETVRLKIKFLKNNYCPYRYRHGTTDGYLKSPLLFYCVREPYVPPELPQFPPVEPFHPPSHPPPPPPDLIHKWTITRLVI